MSKLLTEAFLTEQQYLELTATNDTDFVRSALPAPTEQPESKPQYNFKIPRESNHWTTRLRDPLGDALARINSGKKPAEVLDHPQTESKSPQPEQSENSTNSKSPDFPITLPMYSAEQTATVPNSNKSDNDNRRKFPRRQSECGVAIVRRSETVGLTPQQIDWLLESGRANGRLQNLSQLGICLLLGSEIPPETEVLLRITNEKLRRHVDVSAQVIRSQMGQSGRFSIHCQTLRDLTLDELQDLGQPLPQTEIQSGTSIK